MKVEEPKNYGKGFIDIYADPENVILSVLAAVAQ